MEPGAAHSPRFDTPGQFLRFCVVGALATAVHYAVLSFLMEIVRFHQATPASAIGAVFGIATSYVGNYFWTFRSTKPHRDLVYRFLASYVFTMSVHTAMMYYQVVHLGINYTIAFVIAITGSTLMNFMLAKMAVFEADRFLWSRTTKG